MKRIFDNSKFIFSWHLFITCYVVVCIPKISVVSADIDVSVMNSVVVVVVISIIVMPVVAVTGSVIVVVTTVVDVSVVVASRKN